MAVIYDFPPEILEQVVLELDPLDVARLSRAAKVFYNYIYDPENQLLWRKLYLAQLLDDIRTCTGPLGEPVNPDDIDWRKRLQHVMRARTIVRNPTICREEERTSTLEALLDLIRYLPPGHDIDSPMSLNLAWLAVLLRGGTFLNNTEWLASPKERHLLAQLHTHFGMTTQDFRAERRVESRSYVYSMRNYKPENSYGPFVMDWSGRVNWEHILYLHHCMSMHIIQPLISHPHPDVFVVYPLSLPYCQSTIPPGVDLDKEEDWAGVSGDWICSFAFCDHRELLVYNNYNLSDAVPLRVAVFEDPDFEEAFRRMQVKVQVKCTEADPEHPTRPKIHWEGRVAGIHMMTGWVKVTPDNHIRWHFESGEPGLAMWSSEGIQIGGVRSSFGVLGSWTTVLHDPQDPIGPFLMRKVHRGLDLLEDDSDGEM